MEYGSVLRRRQRWSGFRRRLLILVAALAFVEFKGMPHIRVGASARFRSGNAGNARYWSPLGWRDEHFLRWEMPPFFKIFPLRRSMRSHVDEWINGPPSRTNIFGHPLEFFEVKEPDGTSRRTR